MKVICLNNVLMKLIFSLFIPLYVCMPGTVLGVKWKDKFNMWLIFEYTYCTT